MQILSPEGKQIIEDMAKRHGFSTDAVLSMLEAMIKANGNMAQFNHREFGGSGQWMKGGMTMVSDMFNNHLKNRIESLCFDLAQLVAQQPDLRQNSALQSQYQGSDGRSGSKIFANNMASVSPSGSWWPAALGMPDSAGSQNGIRYAYFAQAHRLAIELNNKLTVYDTLDHRIGGFSQQQSAGGSISFSSQRGLVDLAQLPVVSNDSIVKTEDSGNPASAPTAGMPLPASAPLSSPTPAPSPDWQRPASAVMDGAAILDLIEKLAELRSRGLLSEAEFTKKKTELLDRL